MISWSVGFIFFSALTALLWTKNSEARIRIILAASLVVVFSDNPLNLLLVLATAGVVYRLAWKKQTAFAVVAALLPLVAYKILSAAHSSGTGAFSLENPVIPLGVSYIGFMAAHYAVEVRRGRIQHRSFKTFCHFTLFFPTIAAGPIKRYEDFRPLETSDGENLSKGSLRLAIGLVKIFMISPFFRIIVEAFQTLSIPTTAQCWQATYAAAFWMYFDFSGYSDIAIGASRMLGYRVPENFNWPYLSTNLRTFWRRWHMSLSFWIRDYLYIPLGGNRRGFGRMVLAVLVSMVVMGLWHGLAPGYFFWGLYHGVGLIVYTIYRRWRFWGTDGLLRRTRKVLAAVATFHFVAFGWLFFFFDWGVAIRIIVKLFGQMWILS